MPTADRRPRRRLKPKDAGKLDMEELYQRCRDATPADWDNGLRRLAVRTLQEHGHTAEIAVGIARAFERKPYLIPRSPPKGYRADVDSEPSPT